MQLLIGLSAIVLGIYLLVRPAAYASAMASWMQRFRWSSRMGVPTDGDPQSYRSFARFGAVMMIVVGVTIAFLGPRS